MVHTWSHLFQNELSLLHIQIPYEFLMLCHDLKQCVSDLCGHTPAPDGQEMEFQRSLLHSGRILTSELDGINIIIKSMPKLISLEYLEEKDCMQFSELRGVLSCTLHTSGCTSGPAGMHTCAFVYMYL